MRRRTLIGRFPREPRHGRTRRGASARKSVKQLTDCAQTVDGEKCSFSLLFSVTIRAMKLLPEIEFHEDIRLLIYKPHGLINEAAMNEVIGVIENLEAKLQEPFNRFADTVAADEVEITFKYIIQAYCHVRLVYVCGR